MSEPIKPYRPAGGAFLVEDAPLDTILTPERLDPDARLMADAAAQFMRGKVLPVADRLQQEGPALMPGLLRKAGELGLLGLEIPEAYGGLGLKKSVSARIAEAVAVEPSFAVSHNVHTSVACLPIVFFGTHEQKQRFLPKLATGEWIGAYALSESQAGSDALASRTRAGPSADGRTFHLTGEKMWITNAAFADIFIVFAKVEGDERLTAFVVERAMPGLSIGREEHKLGLKGSSTARLILENVPVPTENVLGAVGEGAKVALYTLNLGRFKIAASSVGQSKNLLGIATRYAKERVAFGKPIAQFGLIQEKLATMAARIFAAESMLYRVAGYLDAAFEEADNGDNAIRNPQSTIHNAASAAEEYAIECAMVKVFCTETLDYCADECLQIHGGYGYTEEFPAARAWRDARVNRIYEGTNEINRLNVVQLLLRRIEKGRLNVDGAKFVPLRLLQIAQSHLPGLAEQQEVCSALAGLITHLFVLDSIVLRTSQTWPEQALPKYDAAEAAATIWVHRDEPEDRLRALRVIAACGQSRNDIWREISTFYSDMALDAISIEKQVANAVIEADGYIW
jgi:alkylation response protein AidB-like acyl-CoA dehydrogenase